MLVAAPISANVVVSFNFPKSAAPIGSTPLGSPLTHDQKLFAVGISVAPSANVACVNSGHASSIWYPDSDASIVPPMLQVTQVILLLLNFTLVTHLLQRLMMRI